MSRTIDASLALQNGSHRNIRCCGRIAQTLQHLIEAGPKGITALDMGTWAVRLSHYVWVLRHRHGIAIATQFEEHGGDYPGKHARYTLLDEIRLETDEQERGAA